MRQLAAIMFADMSGYTALMQENEQLAKSKCQRLKEVLENCMSIFNGKILQQYGDGVNLASRIESLAVPGSIFISEKVFDEIRNQENINVRKIGYFELKNVKIPIRVFAVANEGLVVPE